MVCVALSYVEVDKAYYTVPPEYIGQQVWVRWDSREVRIFNPRWEQIKLHAHLQPGQFDKVLGLGGGHGPLERQQDYWLKRAEELGQPVGQWSRGVLERKGPIGLRSIMGLVGLADQHSFKTINDACASALSRGACAKCKPTSPRPMLSAPSPAISNRTCSASMTSA
ncbi:MAG: hypothetical protein KGS61_01190 [Verrucomicrobia bacterium]|nr:hypothetical protein [Verrucomicrobiota bacterium]